MWAGYLDLLEPILNDKDLSSGLLIGYNRNAPSLLYKTRQFGIIFILTNCLSILIGTNISNNISNYYTYYLFLISTNFLIINIFNI